MGQCEKEWKKNDVRLNDVKNVHFYDKLLRKKKETPMIVTVDKTNQTSK